MPKWLRWLFSVAIFIAILFGVYYAYGQFLVDHSLENLLDVSSALRKASFSENPIERHLFANILNSYSVEEATSEELDMRKLALLHSAARNADESDAFLGIDRAKVYVRNVLEIEQSGQGLFQFLKFHLDRFYYEIRVFLGRLKETFVGKGR
ncbi:MAG: hypothetical protein ACOY3K_08220, partial [Candidatus Omnitrophota bacterium]